MEITTIAIIDIQMITLMPILKSYDIHDVAPIIEKYLKIYNFLHFMESNKIVDKIRYMDKNFVNIHRSQVKSSDGWSTNTNILRDNQFLSYTDFPKIIKEPQRETITWIDIIDRTLEYKEMFTYWDGDPILGYNIQGYFLYKCFMDILQQRIKYNVSDTKVTLVNWNKLSIDIGFSIEQYRLIYPNGRMWRIP